MTENNEKVNQVYTVSNSKPEWAESIYALLEKPNWAPWLAASAETLGKRAEVFPDGQLIIMRNDGVPMASLSMNRINWGGDPKTLPSWDDIAGEPTTYENTFEPKGNTLVMMSMNVNPEFQGEGFARVLIEQAKLLAEKLGVEYLIGSFRPNEYGKHKHTNLGNHLGFESYCEAKREDNWPIDGWLRNLSRNGMQPLAVDPQAMTVVVSMIEFDNIKNEIASEVWIEVAPGVWECGEVGNWKLDTTKATATYKESNLWGLIWEKTGSQ